jgi:hypothetical protein
MKEVASNENVPEGIALLEKTAVVQVSSPQSNGEQRLTALDLVDTLFIGYKQSKTPDPHEEFLHSLLSGLKSMTAWQKCTIKMGTLNL